MNNIEIKVGQIWRESDEDGCERHLLVGALNDTTVDCWVLRAPETTAVSKDKMKLNSEDYVLLTDPELLAAFEKAWGLVTPDSVKEHPVQSAAPKLDPDIKAPSPWLLHMTLEDERKERELEELAAAGFFERREGPPPTQEEI